MGREGLGLRTGAESRLLGWGQGLLNHVPTFQYRILFFSMESSLKAVPRKVYEHVKVAQEI